MQFLIAVDQVVNTMVYLKSEGWGFSDETLSARAWRLRADSNGYKVINVLFFWQDNHCLQAYESEMNRKHLPEEYQK
jgi:hypothetical protein